MAEEPYALSAAPFVPATDDLDEVARAATYCRGCHLWRVGSQTVFGAGNKRARIMLIGEQPGDREDLEGVPFVGPAGRVLRQGLAEAAIDPQDIYMTNAVKHFKWVPKGTRRIHKKPNRPEISACRPWLDAELRIVDPEAILLLGATASQALLGSKFKVTEQRGRALDNPWGRLVVATVHPSSILRALGDDERRQAMEQFVADLKMVASALKHRRAA